MCKIERKDGSRNRNRNRNRNFSNSREKCGVTSPFSYLTVWSLLRQRLPFQTVCRLHNLISPLQLTHPGTPKAGSKECWLLDHENGSVRPAPHRLAPSPPGMVQTGTSPVEAVTPTVDSLDIVRRILCTDDGDEEYLLLGRDVSV